MRQTPLNRGGKAGMNLSLLDRTKEKYTDTSIQEFKTSDLEQNLQHV